MEIEDLLKYMLNFFDNTKKELDNLHSELSQKDTEQQDLLHYIENTNLNASGYAKVGKALKQVRYERRIIKNNIEKVAEVNKFAEKYNNKLITGDIIQLLKSLKNIEKRQEKSQYTYKILKELGELNNERNK